MNFEQVGDLVDNDEANYMKELSYIFNKHEMIFNWEYTITDSKTYSFIAKNENFDLVLLLLSDSLWLLLLSISDPEEDLSDSEGFSCGFCPVPQIPSSH